MASRLEYFHSIYGQTYETTGHWNTLGAEGKRKGREVVDVCTTFEETINSVDGTLAGIRQAIRARDAHGYDIATGYEFHLVEKLDETSYEKTSPGSLISRRYFGLADVLGLDDTKQLPTVDRIAALLRSKK